MSYYTEKSYKVMDLSKECSDYKIFFEILFKDVKGKILDVGCSVGNFISLSPNRIIGIDIDRDALKIAKERGFKVYKMDVEKGLKFKSNSFYGIWANQLIEHLENPLFVMKEFYRVLKPKGKLVCITPDFINTCFKTSSEKEYLTGFRRGFWDDYTHKRPFTKASLYQLAYDAGFRNIEVNHFFKYLRGSRRLVNIGLISFSTIVKLHKFLFNLGFKNKDQLMLIAKK